MQNLFDKTPNFMARLGRLLADVAHRELWKLKEHPWWYVLGVIIVTAPYLNYHYADGIYHSKVFQFNEGVNPSALRTDKDSYCPGEILFIETSVCKTRLVENYRAEWIVTNGHITPVDLLTTQQIAVGCYPKGGGVTLYPLHTIPEDTAEGFHVSAGTSFMWLPGNRPRHLHMETIPYYVKNKNACI